MPTAPSASFRQSHPQRQHRANSFPISAEYLNGPIKAYSPSRRWRRRRPLLVAMLGAALVVLAGALSVAWFARVSWT